MQMVAVLVDGREAPFANMFGADGEEVEDPKLATVAVCDHPDGVMAVVDILYFEEQTRH